jgi:hypothetical protein
MMDLEQLTDLQRLWVAERTMIMRSQGFAHPATIDAKNLNITMVRGKNNAMLHDSSIS